MKKQRVPSDVIVYTLYFLGPGAHFKARYPIISYFFYKMSGEEKFHKLFEDIIFDTSRDYPFNRNVMFAIDRLLKAKILEGIGLAVDEYRLSHKLMIKDNKIDGLFNDEEIILLKEMAERFKKEMGVYFMV